MKQTGRMSLHFLKLALREASEEHYKALKEMQIKQLNRLKRDGINLQVNILCMK